MKDFKTLQKKGFKYICGVDEAGRGPLAGPMSLSFFIVSIDQYKKVLGPLLKRGLNDSKKLSEKKREELYKLLNKENYFNSMISNELIDREGISKCFKTMIKRILKRLPENDKTLFLVDGAIKFPENLTYKTIIGGDSIEPTIMAASIVSKVRRDRRMIRLAKKYPEYEFDIHKGYGTLNHRNAIKKHGCCPIHRISFCKNI